MGLPEEISVVLFDSRTKGKFSMTNEVYNLEMDSTYWGALSRTFRWS